MGQVERPRRILVVDDEPAIREVVASYLREEGFAVDEAADGLAALERVAASPPDLMLLDLNLPHLSGVEVFRRLREQSDLPVIMVTSRVNEVDRVVGLELGADDYVGKPFSPRELVARVKAVLRRTAERPAVPKRSRQVQSVGEIEIDREAHEVRVRGKAAALTPMEFRILDALAVNVGIALSRDQLIGKVSDDGDGPFDRTLDRHVANLRHKIEQDSSKPRHLLTVFGVGYKLVIPG